MKNGYLEIEEQ